MSTAVREKLLGEVEDAFALSKTEMGRIFGVSRQAIDQWHERGIPSGRQEKAATVAAVADLLRHQLKEERVAGVVRRPARAYGGLTALEMIARDRQDELLEIVRGSFDWASPA